MSKGDNIRPCDKKRFDKNFEAIFGKHEIKTWNPEEDEPFWDPAPRADGRMEWTCPHGTSHGNYLHGCDGCCSREDFPGRKKVEDAKRTP